jgi:hypothetical protein
VVRGATTSLLRLNEPVFAGDTVRTGPDGRLQISFVDDSTVNLGANARMEITQYMVDGDRSRMASLRLVAGRMRAKVSRRLSGANDYKFFTPTAVAGVRGTEVVVDVRPRGDDYPDATPEENPELFATEVAVLEGEMGVSMLGDEAEMILGPGMMTFIGHGAPPLQPRRLSPRQQQQLRQSTSASRFGGGPSFAAQSFDANQDFAGLQEGAGGGDTGDGGGQDDIAPPAPELPSTQLTTPLMQQQPTDRPNRTNVIIEIRKR